MSRNLERLYREGKCRECRVLVTRMDFAKILGKFTKVKIQYESSSSSKPKKNVDSLSVNTNSRSKCSENGITPKNSYKKQPTKALRTPKNPKVNEVSVDTDSVIPECDESKKTHPPNNILKENNGLSKQLVSDKSYNYVKQVSSGLKEYGIIFTSPTMNNNNNNNDLKNKLSLLDLLPNLNKSILPSEDWHMDYFPKNEEPKDDKVYDRIAAELEDLMYNEKPIEKLKSEGSEVKAEEFPSIMDILNDNVTEKNPETVQKEIEQSSSEPFKDNIQSNDVEAMLLGKTNVEKDSEPIAMEVDSSDVSKLIEDMDQFNNITDSSKDKDESLVKSEEKPFTELSDTLINPNSPSILDEALKKGIEEHLPNENQQTDSSEVSNPVESDSKEDNKSIPHNDLKLTQLDVNVVENVSDTIEQNVTISIPERTNITHVVFKKMLDNKCLKSVTCPKNLKYNIELEGKPVEFIGAPKYISSLEDLQVLLQIVNESELGSLYVFH
ncbi:hypothetical protein RR46_13811 [Papilio xuthus]|uniref:Uncharacterized protein n=1 Tax=Papilio xuthus TaxID=66420 RepID=A0A194PN97_PAPXU|nr:hypothetical protein RR46_13811 [Papilio xuthus]